MPPVQGGGGGGVDDNTGVGPHLGPLGYVMPVGKNSTLNAWMLMLVSATIASPSEDVPSQYNC